MLAELIEEKPGAHDDVANAVAGVATAAINKWSAPLTVDRLQVGN